MTDWIQRGFPTGEFRQSESGEEALEIYRTWEPDLIFSDYRLKGRMTGYDLGKIVKQDGKSILLLVTGKDYVREEFSMCDGYVKKPFTPSEIIGEAYKRLIKSGKL